MAKQVFKTDMIPHMWANQTQDYARNPQDNLYFRGDIIYSYRDDYPIGKLVRKGDRRAALVQINTYSNTTAKHIHAVRMALHGSRVFHVEVIGTDKQHVKTNMESYAKRVHAGAVSAMRSRTHAESRIADVRKLHAEAMAYADWFKAPKSLRFECPTFDKAWMDKVKAQEAAYKKAKAKELAVREAKAAAEREAAIAEWRAGESDATYLLRGGDVLLRVNGDTVQTSLNAEVPVEDAKRAIRFLGAVLRRGASALPWHRNGETCPVGQFQLDTIDSEGNVKAGCHFIKWPEIVRLAELLGVEV